MDHVHVNIEDLDHFQLLLRSGSEHVADIHLNLRERLDTLGNEWRDREYEAFASVFASTEASLRTFAESAEAYREYLVQLLSYLKEYLSLQTPGRDAAAASGPASPAAEEEETSCVGDLDRAREVFAEQGQNSYGMQSTCGLAVAACVCRQLGLDVTEEDMVSRAVAHRQCQYDPDDREPSGGTTVHQQAALLKSFGLPTRYEEARDLEQIAAAVESGSGVVLNVNAALLWHDSRCFEAGFANHSVSVVGVVRSKARGKIQGFHLNDTGRPDGAARFVDAEAIYAAWVLARGNLLATTGPEARRPKEDHSHAR